MLISSLDQLFKVNPMVIILCSITVILLLTVFAAMCFLVAWLIVRSDFENERNM